MFTTNEEYITNLLWSHATKTYNFSDLGAGFNPTVGISFPSFLSYFSLHYFLACLLVAAAKGWGFLLHLFMSPIIARLPWDTLIRHSSLLYFFYFSFLSLDMTAIFLTCWSCVWCYSLNGLLGFFSRLWDIPNRNNSGSLGVFFTWIWVDLWEWMEAGNGR